MRAGHGRLARAGLAPLALAVFLGSASPAFATGCGGLQAALTGAVAGDTVTLDADSLCTGPFTLPNAAITLQGGAGATIQGAPGARALSGVDIGATRLTNLTIQKGGGAGGGGAIAITGNSAPMLDHLTFLANDTAAGAGGAVSIATTAGSGTVTLDNVSFGDGTPTNHNHSSHGGGALAISSPINVTITNSQFNANATDDVGGGAALIALSGGADLTVTNTSFESNMSNGTDIDLGGGALRLEPSTGSVATVTDSTFHQNQVAAANTAGIANGGAIHVSHAGTTNLPSLVLSGNTFDANSISGGSPSNFSPTGGALNAVGAFVTSRKDRFTANTIPPGQNGFARGAAIALAPCVSSGPIPQNLFESDVIAGNKGAGSTLGGSIYLNCGLAPTNLRVRQSTLAGNQTAGGIAGIKAGPNDILTSENSIIGPDTGGEQLVGFSTRNITYTDLCINGAPHNDVGNICADPRLADPTTGDVLQTASSPTVDAGSNALANGITTDYEGEPRLQDGNNDSIPTVDIGVDERPRTVGCAMLAADFARAAAGASIRLTQGSTCTGSYDLPHLPITLSGDGTGATFQPAGGRALYGDDSGTTTLRNLVFTGGSGAPGGAVLFEGASNPTIDTVKFLDNHSADVGGALAIFSTSATGTITVTDTHFGDDTAAGWNSASKGGGAAIYPGPAPVYLTRTSFERNEATAGAGGGLYLARGTGSHVMKSVSFTKNNVIPDGGFDGRGGGAYMEANPAVQPLDISGLDFSGNTIAPGSGALAGAGLSIVGVFAVDEVHQGNNRFTGNSFTDASGASSVSGAGESVENARLISHEDRFASNQIGAHGSADARGVALALDGCSPIFPATQHAISNDVLAGNTGTGNVSGALSAQCATSSVGLNILNTTIVANIVGGDTAGIWGAGDETLSIVNSIVMANSGGEQLTGFGTPSITFSDMCASGSAYPGTGNICADPALADIPHADVHETASSPTVDRGSNGAIPAALHIDYEGHDRILDSDKNGSTVVDMGADEKLAPAPPVVVPVTVGPFDFGSPVPVANTPADTPPAANLVADAKTSAPAKKPTPTKKPKKCGDRTGPTSRFLNKLSHAARFNASGTVLAIRGVATYKKCKGGKAGKIKRVNFTVKRVVGNRCSFLTKSHTFGPLTSCRHKATLFRAKGTTKWSFALRGPLVGGKYLAQVQAVDNLGNKERLSSHRNFRHFRVDSRQLKQGWNGNHPDDYTKRG
ncbi:MAG: beta strand repeat-containing protein [Thermoleophilaceae bacterium]